MNIFAYYIHSLFILIEFSLSGAEKTEKNDTNDFYSCLLKYVLPLKEIDRNGLRVLDLFYDPANRKREEDYSTKLHSGENEDLIFKETPKANKPNYEQWKYGFVTTMKLNRSLPIITNYNSVDDTNRRVYAIDCEMCITIDGSELIRVSVVDEDLNVIYNRLVNPINKINDLCTRFHGIEWTDMKYCRTRLASVQNDLLKIINHRTILIGHDITNDLRALKIYHANVVDTSIVYTENRFEDGERRYKLSQLVRNVLGMTLHEAGMLHDSVEDARMCMRLMIEECSM